MMTRLRIFLVAAFIGLIVQQQISADEQGRRLLTADSSKKRIALIDGSGKTIWEHRIGPLHDLHVLPSGNILFQASWTRLIEVDPETREVVWEYDSAVSNGNKGRRVEVHAFQRLPGGLTMIAESGVSRIIEVDSNGRLVKLIPLQVSKPNPHRDTRLARKLDNGHYLVCHEGDGVVKEYNGKGKVVWEYAVPLFGRERKGGHGVDAFGKQCFSAVRLPNGNTLIGTGNGHSVLEVSPKKEIVWSLRQNDLPGIQLAWVTTLQVLPDGNIVIGNCHAGPQNPQIIEVTREKKVVWTFRDFERFGNALTNTQVLARSNPVADAKTTRVSLADVAAGRAKIVDLTWALNEKNAYWPGGNYKPFELKTIATLEKDGVLSKAFSMPEHLGTHIDAPNHFEKNQPDVASIRPEDLIGPGVVIDIESQVEQDPDTTLSMQTLKEWESEHGRIPDGAIVLLKTGWGRFWNNYSRYKNQDVTGRLHFPGYSKEAAQFLVEKRKARGLGIDTLSIDPGISKDFAVHHVVNGASRYGLENVASLERLPPRGFHVIVAPLKIDHGSGGPARILAILDRD